MSHLMPSPDSQTSDAHTPGSDHHSGPSRTISTGGKRPASTGAGAGDAARKKARHEDEVDDDDESITEQTGPQKPKTTRGAR